MSDADFNREVRREAEAIRKEISILQSKLKVLDVLIDLYEKDKGRKGK